MQPPLQFSRLTGVFSPDEVERTYLESQFAGSTIAYIAFTLFLLLSHVILHFLGHTLSCPTMNMSRRYSADLSGEGPCTT